MPDFSWNPAWETGVARIDRQHRELLDRMAKLSTAIEGGQDDAELERTLLYLGEYVEFHFHDEEELMEASGYPAMGRHKDIHNDFRLSVKALVEKYLDGHQAMQMSVMEFLLGWLVLHLSSEDRQMAEHLRAHPV